jgi:hypothetical protein
MKSRKRRRRPRAVPVATAARARRHFPAAAVWRVLMLCCAAGFAFTLLHSILRFGVNVPFWDEWDCIRALRRAYSGETSYAQLLFSNQNEHRIGTVVLLASAVWHATGMHLKAGMVWNWFSGVVFCVLALLVTRKTMPGRSTVPWTVLAAASFFVFSPAAYQVWLWALPPVYLWVPLLFLAGIASIQSSGCDRNRLLVAAGCSLLASFILASGLLLWVLFPVVLVPYLAPGAYRRERLGTGIYATLLLFSTGSYGIGLLDRHSSAPTGFLGLGAVSHFYLAYTGNLVALSADPPPVAMAERVGAALLLFFTIATVLALLRLRGKPQRPAAFVWCAMGLYGAGSGVLVALGRHQFGISYALEASRYVLASCFLPIACMALGCILTAVLAAEAPSRPYVYSGVLCGTIALTLSGAVFRILQTDRAQQLMEHTHYWNLGGKVALAAANLLPVPEYRHIYPSDNWDDFKMSANFLNRRGWLDPPLWDQAFVVALAAPRRTEETGFGRVDKTETLPDGRIRLSGWAYLADRDRRADAVIILGTQPSPARTLRVVVGSSGPAGGWSGEIPGEWGAAVHCFAYDAEAGRAHLLSGGQGQ